MGRVIGTLICLAVGLGLMGTVAGCGRQVNVSPPNPIDPRCERVISALPDTIDGAGKRPVKPDSTATAAWGEPPIVLRCGVARPAALTPTSALIEVSGVAWLPEELANGILFTNVAWPDPANPLYLEIAVPEAYPSPANVLADISPVLASL